MNLDKLLKEKLEEEKNNVDLNIDIDEIIKKAESKKVRKKVHIALVACLVIISILLVSAKMYNLDKKENMNNIQADSQIEDKLDENYGLIEVELDESNEGVSARRTVYNNYDWVFSRYNTSFDTANIISMPNLVIAKADNLEYYNYTEYNQKHGLYGEVIYYGGYCSARTRVDLTIEKVILGDLKIGETIKAYTKGGIVSYDDYMNYRNEYPYSSTNFDKVDLEYNTLLKEGKKNIYVSEYLKEQTRLEEKTYLLIVYQKVWGENYIEPYNYWLREYDNNTGLILNNVTGEWETLEKVLGENTYE